MASSLQHQQHSEHLLVHKAGKLSYVLVPPLPTPSQLNDEPLLCFMDHDGDPGAFEQCCPRDCSHVRAHYHHGDIIEDVLLHECVDIAGCGVPLPWELPGLCLQESSDEKGAMIPSTGEDHLHKVGCGHGQIAHGDHLDCLVPMSDGTFALSHVQVIADGTTQNVPHGCLVKIEEASGKLKQRCGFKGLEAAGHNCCAPKTMDVVSVDLCSAATQAIITEDTKCSLERPLKLPWHEEGVKLCVDDEGVPPKLQNTMIDVFGICCPAEVPVIRKILEPLPGVHEVLVNVAAKTVIVHHDPLPTSAAHLVKLLNDARLEASIHHPGEWKAAHKWPTPNTIASGILVAVALFHYVYSPLRWVGLGAVAVGIPPILLRSYVSVRRCVLDINVLMLIAVAGAVALGDYMEAGSIVFLFTLADWLESRSSDKARLAIASIASLAPQSAILASNGARVPVEEVKIGTRLSVKAGEHIPIDGIIVSGRSAVDESSLTGESVPVEKEAGGRVWAGTINLTGYMCMETSALAEDSAVSRLVQLVEEAQAQRSRTDQLVDKFAKYYTPVVVAAALVLAIVPASLHVHNVQHWLYIALVLLVVACPCALVISTPVTTTCAIAQAARMGLIIKGGKFLEVLGKLKIVALDKTGTLTEGNFQVKDVLTLMKGMDLRKLLYWISSVESKSSHPLASAIVAYAKQNGIEPSGDVEDFTILVGEGVSGVIDGHKICIGNDRLADRLQWIQDEVVDPRVLQAWKSQGLTISWISVNEIPSIIMRAGDQLRAEAPEAVEGLRKLGLRIAMLTGDSLAAAAAVHCELGNIDTHARLLPEDKVELIKGLRSGGLVAMVGDGINDAPALAAADVGIAMGVAGTAIAMETADIALMSNDLRRLSVAVELGRKARLKVQQNIVLSVLTKALIIMLAAFGYASLWGAVLGDVGTCLAVIFNSMLLLRPRKERACTALNKPGTGCHNSACGPENGSCCSRSKLLEASSISQEQDDPAPSSRKNAESSCVQDFCCELSCASSTHGMKRRAGHKDNCCSKDCHDVKYSSVVLTEGGCSSTVPPVSEAASLSTDGDLRDCGKTSGNCCVRKPCCASGKKIPNNKSSQSVPLTGSSLVVNIPKLECGSQGQCAEHSPHSSDGTFVKSKLTISEKEVACALGRPSKDCHKSASDMGCGSVKGSCGMDLKLLDISPQDSFHNAHKSADKIFKDGCTETACCKFSSGGRMSRAGDKGNYCSKPIPEGASMVNVDAKVCAKPSTNNRCLEKPCCALGDERSGHLASGNQPFNDHTSSVVLTISELNYGSQCGSKNCCPPKLCCAVSGMPSPLANTGDPAESKLPRPSATQFDIGSRSQETPNCTSDVLIAVDL